MNALPAERDDPFARIRRLVGQAGMDRLDRSFVVVVGLGAVGSHATEALARGAVGRMRLVDFDRVHPSNLNRQLYALHSTLGQSKAQLAARRVGDIHPACRVEPLECFAHVDTFDRILSDQPDLVIDSIDSLSPKVELLASCCRRGLNVISVMGAALRTDPGRIRISPLSRTRICPLARQVRKQLRSKAPQADPLCVWSDEPILDLPEESVGEPESEPAGLQRGRPRRVLGSLPTLPGIFGLTAANAALEILLGPCWPGKP